MKTNMILELWDENTGVARRWNSDINDVQFNELWDKYQDDWNKLESQNGTMYFSGSLDNFDENDVWVMGWSSSEVSEFGSWDTVQTEILRWLDESGYSYERIEDHQYELEDEDEEEINVRLDF